MPRTISTAERYHQDTKYSEEGLRRQAHSLDWSAKPQPFHEHVAERRLNLGPLMPFGATDDPAPVGLSDEERESLTRLSALLHCTNGVTRTVVLPDGQTLHMRAAPSAGALYPTEVYVAARGFPGLPDGLWNHDVRDHALVPLWEGDFWPDLQHALLGHPLVEESELALVMTGVWQRSAWRYQERGYRRALLDTGHVIGNAALYAPEVVWDGIPVFGFADRPLNDMLLLDDAVEGALGVVLLAPRGSADGGRCPGAPAGPATPAADMDDDVGPDIALHRAAQLEPGERHPPRGDQPDPESLHTDGPTVKVPYAPPAWDDHLERVIARRRSTRSFSAEPVSLEELGTILRFADRSRDEDGADGSLLPAGELVRTYVLAVRVEGLEDGAWYWAPESGELRRVAEPGPDWPNLCARICLGQDLGRDAAAIVVHATDLKAAVARYGDRAYRYAHLDAGMLGQRMALAAVRLELGTSGIGGFFDDEVCDVLDLPHATAVCYLTTIGRPGPLEV